MLRNWGGGLGRCYSLEQGKGSLGHSCFISGFQINIVPC